MNLRQIGSLASLLSVDNQGNNSEMEACANKGADATCCIHSEASSGFGGCYTCIATVMESIVEAEDCDSFKANNPTFCSTLTECFVDLETVTDGKCAYFSCKDKIEPALECAHKEEANECPDLCKEELGFAFPMKTVLTIA
eukprot:CAMPEP_0181119940 /NCGR_PEP_ID=MMETSP1071-20121207/23874_1 /TAXON_ID=35127 /ORGANISM="Thalassiosira sp., Strain NH16" /LENGTH=140 /DNA_ID=CAMNT_0023204529 /DNA_START=43 /DNA_END=465 /DNA_ORIENTATION=-